MPLLNLPPALADIAGFAADKPLADPSLPSSAVKLSLPSQSTSFDIPGAAGASPLGSFALSADESASIAVINSASDPDPTGFFNLENPVDPTAPKAADAALSEPPAVYQPDLAYVVISGLAVSGKLSGNFSIGTAGTLGLDGSAALDACACMAFPRASMAWASLRLAAAQFKTLFSVGELLALQPAGSVEPTPWQILSFGVQTELALSLALSAPSLASALADSVDAVLKRAGPFSFSSTATATLTVSVGATDGYRVFAQRAAAGAITFAVKKTSSTSLGLDAGLGLNLTITDPALDDVVNSVFDQAAGVALGTLKSILTPGPGGLLDASQQQSLHNLVAKLGLAGTAGTELQALQTKLTAFKADLVKRLSPTVAAQFTYSWKRLTSDALVAQCTVTDAALPGYHADILALNLTRLLAAPATQVVFSRLLGQSTTDIEIGYGFSFGTGRFALKSQDSQQIKFVELRTYAPNAGWLRQFSFLGKRAYDATWFGTDQSNYVELDASMAVPSVAPSLADFQTGFTIAFTWKNYPFSQILSTVADHGVVVDAFTTSDVDVASKSLQAAGATPNFTGDAVVSLTVGDAVLRRLLPVLTGSAYVGQLAPNALARALPYCADFPERVQVDRRMQTYGQVWADILVTEDFVQETIAKICASVLPNVAGGKVTPDLRQSESNYPGAGWTVQAVAAMVNRDGLIDAVNNQAPQCFHLLAQPAGDFRSLFPKCVEAFAPLAAQNFGSRVLASLLVLAAGITPGCSDLFSRSVQLTWKNGGQNRTVVVKKGQS